MTEDLQVADHHFATGASTGDACDGALARANAIALRTAYMSSPDLRWQINAVKFNSSTCICRCFSRVYGFFRPLHRGIVAAAEVTPEGEIVRTASVGASNTFLHRAERIISELNSCHPAMLRGFHDLWEPCDPPTREPLPVVQSPIA